MESRPLKLIRIVYESPARPAQPLTLQCHYECAEDVQYAALSYVWGDDGNQPEIFIDGTSIAIRHNLHQFLLLLRERRVESLLWVDSLCIDQDDEEEKTREVNRMGDIFGQAMKVYHWLGPEGDDSDFLFDAIIPLGRTSFELGILDFVEKEKEVQDMEILHFMRDKYPHMVPGSDEIAKAIFSEALIWTSGDEGLSWAFDSSMHNVHEVVPFILQLTLENPEGLTSTRSSNALRQLLRRDFFQRVWIVQELALGRNSILMCGKKEMLVDHFDSFLSLVDGRLSLWTLARSRPHPQSWMRDVSFYLRHPPALTARQARRSGSSSLWSILEAGIWISDVPQLAATDPRDIIFGLLGVIDDKEVLGLSADYSKSTARVFSEATSALIQHCREYDICWSGFRKDTADLPSWVPDWERLARLGFEYIPLSSLALHKFCPFKMTEGERWAETAPHFESWAVLVLYGFRVGCISSVIPPQSLPKRTDSEEDDQDSFDRILMYCYENGVTNHDAIIRTCMMNNATVFRTYEECDDTYCKYAKKAICGESMILEECSPEAAKMLSQYRSLGHGLNKDGSQENDSLQYAFWCFFHYVRRKFLRRLRRGTVLFITEDKRLGLAPLHIAQGDFVAIVQGQSMPLIFRPAGHGSCEFVAEAYMDGIMNGEAMREEDYLEAFRVI
ncbi:heterokaryon incompatibility protein-domain-containing protein [Stachybotrys elegans]|uniref:Heterokaryon incompatibility protein-domain-containing protein n=1 Tax=Stachybotrys elegans TaxID=80388 RepID=A0A8K0WZA1_9HYPO|nr:heterokaryon incompatibility protein-domain-containing protein [Stachybotrys elegans]